MPKIIRVKKAQALYHTKPVLDEDGQPKVVPVTNPRTGEQKVSGRGRPVTRPVTVRDLDRPKPNLRCDFPGCGVDGGEILPGSPYKYMKLRHRQINRHAEHPDWQYWEYSSSVAAQAARLQSDMHDEVDSWAPESEDDFDDIKTSLAGQALDFADEREESLGNMPEGLQSGLQAEEYAEAARAWADELEGVDAPSEEAHEDCETCDGTGKVTEECAYCGGTGLLAETVEGDEDTDPDEECTQCGGEREEETECPDCE